LHLRRATQIVGGVTRYSVYDVSGGLVSIDQAGAGPTEYIRASGMVLARVAGTGSTGSVVWRESEQPFGEDWISAPANDNQAGYTGHVEDAATGLVYMQARYYNPVTGRFLANDPVGFSPTRPDMFNRYAYAGNDPVNNWDPDGRQCLGCKKSDFAQVESARADLERLREAKKQQTVNINRAQLDAVLLAGGPRVLLSCGATCGIGALASGGAETLKQTRAGELNPTLIATEAAEGGVIAKFSTVSATATAFVSGIAGGGEQIIENALTGKPTFEGVKDQSLFNAAGGAFGNVFANLGALFRGGAANTTTSAVDTAAGTTATELIEAGSKDDEIK
jgi:RHS repeat-associated protein